MEIFVTYIYQPFFNILVLIYWALGQFLNTPDMGIAVVIFALVVRIILLPIDLATDRSAKEKQEMAKKIQELKTTIHDPIKRQAEIKALFRTNPAALISEIFSVFVQLTIILMLYRIFKTGLEGQDLNLVYSFVPPVVTPINLNFLGLFDLSKTNHTLNLIQSFLIFTLESLSMLLSPKPVDKKEYFSVAILMPIVSFFIFALLPAGKKVFIITSLLFSITLLLLRQLWFWYYVYLKPVTK